MNRFYSEFLYGLGIQICYDRWTGWRDAFVVDDMGNLVAVPNSVWPSLA